MRQPAAALCRTLGLDTPILQAGMGWVSTGRLAAAVSAAGGLGVIATGGIMPPDELRQHIQARAAEHFWRARAGCVDGDWNEGFFPAGQCVELIDEVLPAARIVEELSTLAVVG